MTLEWHEDDYGCLTGIAWEDWLDRRDKYIDPYLVWADIANSASYGAYDPEDSGAPQKWPFIVELVHGDPTAEYFNPRANDGRDDVPWIFGIIDIPGIYKRESDSVSNALPDSSKIDGQYITARLYPCDVIHLLCSEHVCRAQLGLPRIPIGPTAGPVVPLDQATGTPRVVLGIIDDGFGFAHPRLLDANGAPRVRYLWDQDKSRERDWGLGSWSEPDSLGYGAELDPLAMDRLLQRTPSLESWLPYRQVDYGRFKLEPQAHSSAPRNADNWCLPMATMLAHAHGHSVLDLAAGYPPRHRGQSRPLQQSELADPRASKTANVFFEQTVPEIAAPSKGENEDAVDRIARMYEDPVAQIDSADQWAVVCVQLPTRTVADTSGGSLAVHVLDGLRYIVDRAQRIPRADDPQPEEGKRLYTSNRVIANVSYGSHGGGHDGTSILECAMAALVEKSAGDRLWIVLAAGNAHGASAHARLAMKPGDRKTLSWEVAADNPLESYLEIWLPDQDVNGCSLPDGVVQQIHLSLQPPGGPPLPLACNGSCWQLRRNTGEAGSRGTTVAGVVYAHHVVQSLHGTMILVAVAPTRVQDPALGPRAAAPYGEWTVCLFWGGPETAAEGPQLEIHAWTERNDLVFGAPRRQQSRIYADEPTYSAKEFDPEFRAEFKATQANPGRLRTARGIRPEVTLSSLATVVPARPHFALAENGKGQVVVVGGYRMTDEEVSAVSSGGPERRVNHSREWEARTNRKVSECFRVGPDVDAPSDLSPAVAGLRTAGFHSSVESRISATSAAAALTTRAIANVQFAALPRSGNRRLALGENLERLLFADGPKPSDAESSRATLTPRADDAFRRGRKRLR